MIERVLIRAAIAALACSALASCTGISGDQACVGDACMPSGCSNGVQDGQETDVDCGGAECRQCPGTRRCASPSDCFSGKCDEGTCYALAVSFADSVAYPSGFKPYVMMSGDLDGDGDLDLAAANEIGSAVAVFRNTGAGLFEPVPAPTASGFPTGEYPTGGAIADFNHDAIPDVVTADYHGNSVSILLGAGTGDAYALTACDSYPTVAGAETSNLAVGDLDGDTHTDVIATNPQASSASVFRGRADGTLAPAVQIDLGEAEPYSVAIADFDGDGIADAAIADNYNLAIHLLHGNGDGTFEIAMERAAIGGAASFILVTHDMDVDGVLDLVVANRSSHDVSVLLGRGDGTFAEPLVSPTGDDTGPYALAIADFNLDAVPDVVTANFLTSNASVLLGIGNGLFDAPIDAGATGTTPYGITAGDFDGDGKPDLATANAISDDVTVKRNTSQ